MPSHSDDRRLSSKQAAVPTAMRLQRYLAATGLGSRRKCEEYITAGRVNVDGQVVRDFGTRVEPGQEVRVDGELARLDPPRYFLLNKPRGYLCTNSDPAGRLRAIDLLPPSKLRLFTVGRLDESSEGLILLTNDGDLAHRLAHPRFQVPRTYAVQVAGRPNPETFAALKEGLYFQEGRFHVHWVKRAGTKGNSTFLEVGLSHGQNREIRRLFARVGHKVMRLRRTAFGPLSLGKLAEGRFRPLTSTELSELRDLASGKRRHRPENSRNNRTRGRRPPLRSVPETAAADSPGEQPHAQKREAHRHADRPAGREEFRAERKGSSQSGKPRTRHHAGTSRTAGGRSASGRGERAAAAQPHSPDRASRGQRKRRQRHA
jgi:23S rRNA pseudouridine2605 synthase